MSQEKTRFLSYICPRCRQSVIVEKDVFALAASPTRIQCPCGHSELDVEFLPQRVRRQPLRLGYTRSTTECDLIFLAVWR